MQKVLIAGLVSLALVSTAQAGMLYNASYTDSSGGVTAFMLDGDLQPDGDTVIVNSLLMDPTYNGVDPMFSSASLDSVSNIASGSGAPPTLSISGLTMDFLWTHNAASDGFLFDTTGFIGVPAFNSGPSFGLKPIEPIVLDNWSLTEKTSAVPEPSTFALLGIGGVALIGYGYRRKRKQAA